jgi:hypothetical protein
VTSRAESVVGEALVVAYIGIDSDWHAVAEMRRRLA